MGTQIRLIKLSESESPLHPNNIPIGYVKEGEKLASPKVGECFWVGSGWRTSTVQEILSEDTFRTHNSIYKIESIAQ